MKANIRLGFLMGVGLATLYSAWALGLFILSGADPFEKHQTSILAVVTTYYVAGMVGGVAVGSLLRIGRSLPGRITLGIVASFVLFVCVSVATQGPPWRWPVSEWRDVVLLALLFGVICSLLWRRVTGL